MQLTESKNPEVAGTLISLDSRSDDAFAERTAAT